MMNKTAERTVTLEKGRVDIYTKNGITLYAYQTHDAIDNEQIAERCGQKVTAQQLILDYFA